MAEEDILLPEEMGRLEIETTALRRSRSDDNPFYNNVLSHNKKVSLKKTALSESCFCMSNKKTTSYGICKRKHNKILKEPVLQILKTCVDQQTEKKECQNDTSDVNQSVNIDTLSLCTLVKNCNQLKISCGAKELSAGNSKNDKTKWWKNEVVCPKDNRKQNSSQPGSCSQQALNPPCDVTIDELASYFETLVHIPKKMSSMAEMMYI